MSGLHLHPHGPQVRRLLRASTLLSHRPVRLLSEGFDRAARIQKLTSFSTSIVEAKNIKPPLLLDVRCCAKLIPTSPLTFPPKPETAVPSSLSAEVASASSLSVASELSANEGSLRAAASDNAYETTLSDGSVVTVTPTPFVSTLSDGDETTITPTPSTSTMSDGRLTTIFSPTPDGGNLQNHGNDDSDDDGVPTWAIVVPSPSMYSAYCFQRLTRLNSHPRHSLPPSIPCSSMERNESASTEANSYTSRRTLHRAQHSHCCHKGS